MNPSPLDGRRVCLFEEVRRVKHALVKSICPFTGLMELQPLTEDGKPDKNVRPIWLNPSHPSFQGFLNYDNG